MGKEALAAVGTTSSIINTLVGFAAGLSTGASVVISQCYGSHDHKGLHHAVHTSICVTFLLGAAFTAVGILGADTLLRLQSTPEDVFTEAHTYLTIYFSGMLGLLTYNMGSGILRAVGDSRRPLYFLVFSAIVNTILDLVFVVLLGMGVEGVAYATIIAQFLSAALTLWVLTRDHAPYGIHWGHLSIDVPTLKRIISIGLPSGIQQAITSFSNVFVQGYINFFGSACMAGWSSYNKLDAFILIPMQAIAMASTTFVGQNFGARQIERARQGRPGRADSFRQHHHSLQHRDGELCPAAGDHVLQRKRSAGFRPALPHPCRLRFISSCALTRPSAARCAASARAPRP